MESTETSAKALRDSASFGGPRWRARAKSHQQELHAGGYWSPCGVTQEAAPLRGVLLSWPPDSLDTDNLEASLLLRKVNLRTLRAQTEAVASFYERRGIRVHLYRPSKPAPPNLIFMRDTFFMTPEGAFLGRMGGEARAGEERFVAEALASNAIPIVRAVRGLGCLEGADALWLSERKVLIAKGFRTNEEGSSQLRDLLCLLGVSVEVADLPRGTQHLLGVVNFVDANRAVVRADLLTTEIRNALEREGISLLCLQPTEEVVHRFAMNFVTLGPNCVVMPGNCASTREIYEANGIETFELDLSEYLNAGGGLGCLTGIVERSNRAG